MEPGPLRIQADTLVPSVMVLGGGAFRRGLGDGGRALGSGINVPVKEAPENTPPPGLGGTRERNAVYEQEVALTTPWPAGTLTLDFQHDR